MIKVWLSSKKQRGGSKRYYYLRWIDPVKGWQSEAIKVAGKPCTDRKRAEGERVKREEALAEGTYQQTRKTTWTEFVQEHCKLIPGKRHHDEAERILTEFGNTYTGTPDRITFAVVEGYAEACKAAGNNQATINKKLRYLRAALNKAVRRGYARKNPMTGWTWAAAKRPAIRTATPSEQKAVLACAVDLYGLPMFGLVYTALYTGGRKGELLGLSWDDVDAEARRLTFRDTKSHTDREITLTPETVGVLMGVRRNLPTVLAGGPFRTLGDVDRKWRDLRAAAGVPDLTIHDLRRTYITTLIRNGVPLPTVQRLAGHAKIQTTLEYYNAVSEQDRRDAVATLRPTRKASAG